MGDSVPVGEHSDVRRWQRSTGEDLSEAEEEEEEDEDRFYNSNLPSSSAVIHSDPGRLHLSRLITNLQS